MADLDFRNIGRWAAGALCAAAVSLAHAQPPHMAYLGAHGPGGGQRASFGWQPMRGPHADSRANAAAPRRVPREAADPRMAAAAGGSWARPPGGARGDAAAYGGRIQPVSEMTRPFQQQDSNPPYMRAGSIRADVNRYNEERGSEPHMVPRPPSDVPRPPPPSPYRN